MTLGISISHGVPSTRSALTIANLGKQLAHTLTSSEWREIRMAPGNAIGR